MPPGPGCRVHMQSQGEIQLSAHARTHARTDPVWQVKQLKQILNDRGVDCNGCIEKNDFVKKVMDTAHMDL